MQVVADVATAIEKSAAAGVAHRDIKPSNFGHIEGRGILYDYLAGQVSAGLSMSSAGISLRTCGCIGMAPLCKHRILAMWLQGTHVPCSPAQLACMANACVFALEIDHTILSLRCTGHGRR